MGAHVPAILIVLLMTGQFIALVVLAVAARGIRAQLDIIVEELMSFVDYGYDGPDGPGEPVIVGGNTHNVIPMPRSAA